jgi:Cu(I)/Ag(I) efflux system protein CusF
MRVSTLALLGALTLAIPAAAMADDMPGMKGMAKPAAQTAKTAKGTGVVTEINAKNGSLTIQHEPIAAFGWPAMTMSFKANPVTLLKGVKVGQKIGFDANSGTALPEVTAIRKR